MESRKQIGELLDKHLTTEHIKQLNLNKYPVLLKKTSLKPRLLNKFSTRQRIDTNISQLKYIYNTTKTGNICTCFKITYAGSGAIYAYLYSRYDPNNEPTIEHRFFCCGGSYKSQDGEYRDRVLPYARFLELYERYSNIMEIVEKSIVNKITNSVIALHADFFYPNNFNESERKFEDSINSLRLPIKFYILCWLKDYFDIRNNYTANHLNSTYKSIINDNTDNLLYETITKELGFDNFLRLYNKLSYYYTKIDSLPLVKTELRCGQKLFPMTFFEAIKIHDINFAIWRELYISVMCSNLVLNFVSPSFSFINDWFYIENAHSGLFDNTAMHEKYKYSEIAESISGQLRDIDKFNYVERVRERGPINSRFMRLSKRIQKSIVYADSSIKLTDLAVCVTSEYVGKTFYDVVGYATNATRVGYSQMFINTSLYTKHIFEYIYGFYCMNTKIGVIHGDLHLNNITMYEMCTILPDTHPDLFNPSIIYILRNKMYKFPHYGIFSCVIDFSRSIIGDTKKLIELHGETFTEMFVHEQNMRIMRILFTYFSRFMEKNHVEIGKLLINQFDLCFKILTGIDPFVVCNSMNNMYSDKNYTNKISKENIKLTTKIANFAETLILDSLNKAINGDIKQASDIEWPCFVILSKYFQYFELSESELSASVDADISAGTSDSPPASATDIAEKPARFDIIDVFNENNELKYDCDNEKMWSPLLLLDYEYKLQKKYNFPGTVIAVYDKWVAAKARDNPADLEKLLNRYEQREQDIINIEPWMLY